MNVQEYVNINPTSYDEIMRINKVFAPFNIMVNEVIRCAQSVKYILNLPLDITIQGKIKKNESNIVYTLSSALLTQEYNYGHENNYVFIERPASLNSVNFANYYDFNSNRLMLAMGTDSQGNRKKLDLAKAVHILVGGVTGSGKSELLHSFVCSLIKGMNHTGVELVIIDPKRAEYSPYKGCRSISVVTDMNHAERVLAHAVDIMEYRYSILEQSGAKDIKTYRGNADMHPIVYIIDELADLVMNYKSCERNIALIAQKSRACGIHLIIGTQSPRRDIVTGLIKANIPTRIALKTSSSLESRIIMERSGAEKLLGKGDMLYLGNGMFEPVRLQSAYVDESLKWQIANTIRMPIQMRA